MRISFLSIVILVIFYLFGTNAEEVIVMNDWRALASKPNKSKKLNKESTNKCKKSSSGGRIKKSKTRRPAKLPILETKKCEPLLTDADKSAGLCLKSDVFGGFQFAQASRFVNREEEQTLLSFQTSDFLWFAWEVADEMAEELQNEIPEGFEISKVSVSKGESSKYYIVLNVYSVTISGSPSTRAEWSTFVYERGSDKNTPFFMILDAPTNTQGVEPTSCVLKKPAHVSYLVDNGTLKASITARGGNFDATFNLHGKPFELDQSFKEASERNYWLSGVYDKGYYNGVLMSSKILLIEKETFSTLIDTTYWATLTQSHVPEYTFYYEESPIEFILKPWYNLSYLKNKDMTLHNCLDQFKFSFGFGPLALSHAVGVIELEEENILNYEILGSAKPTLYINFKLSKKDRVNIEKTFAGDLKLAKIKFKDQKGKKEFFKTLRISDGGISGTEQFGLRAEWITYVKCKNGDKIYQMILDTKSGYPRLNPNNFQFEGPVDKFEYNYSSEFIKVVIEDSPSAFSLNLNIPISDMKAVNPDFYWLLSHDRVYARNGVYDAFFCNTSLYGMHLFSISPLKEDGVASVYVGQNDIECVIQSLRNLEESD